MRFSTAGVKLGYAVETTAGTKPTTGYTYIPELKEIPENNPEPSLLETTTLDETETKTYIPGLKDLGSTLTYLANFTEDFKEAWETLVTKYETAKAGGKATWFVVRYPGITESCYFTGEPSTLGQPGAAVDSVQEVNVYITPTSAPEYATAPTEE